MDNASTAPFDRQHRQMRLWLTLLDPARPDRAREVLVTAPAGARVADVRRQLVGPGVERTALYAGSRCLADGDLLGVPPLLEGALLTIGPPLDGGAGTQQRPALLRLEVTGGPDSGRSFPLAPGRYVLGRAVDAALRVDDPDLSRAHLSVEVSTTGTLVCDLGTTNGTLLSSADNEGSDGAHLKSVGSAPTPWPPATTLRAGGSTFLLRVHGSPSAATTYDGLGHVLVNRQPRSFTPLGPVEIRRPAAPEARSRVRLPLLPMLVPVLLALPMAWLQRAPAYLLFGLMSPAMMLASHVSDRRGGRRADRRRRNDWERQSACAARDLAAAVARETEQRHAAAPDLALLAQTASVPLASLWERRPDDEDFLFLRLGLGDRPALVRLVAADDAPAETPTLIDVPLGVRLPDVGVLGLAGERPEVLRLARALVAQVATCHSPRDVGLVLLAADAEALDDWTWAARLPHARLGLLDRPGQVGARLDELLTELDDRRARTGAVAGRTAGAAWRGPALVVLLAGARRLRPVPGLARVLDEGPAVGIYAICLDEHRNRLPVECGAVVQLPDEQAGPASGPVLMGVHPGIGDVRLDGVSGAWAEQLGRALAPLRDATPDPGRADVPDRARLVDLLDLDPADPEALAHHWSTGTGSTVAVVGATADGPYAVDLRRDGPHVLVGGTTGSGKSELLQTLITSLAVANSPQQLGFVLVDYKGGAAFQQCAELPHTLGLVTDLDPQLTERALASLRAELKRREQLLRAAGARDLDEYARVRAAGDLPRLVLVIDEFRMLAEEQPAFLDGMLRIAALGRSLGVHLVLATQRPAGVVSADIAANVNLRIALRVRDQADSEDVVDAPDAAGISAATPGRAYARSAAQPLVLFQTARVAVARSTGPAAPVVRTVTVADLGDPPRGPAHVDSEDTDLRAIVAAAREATRRLGLPPVASPWLPPLPEVITLDQLDGARSGWRVPYAVLDRPERQAQETLAWDLEHDGHLLVVGGPRSGRSTCLRTLAGSLAGRLAATEVHLHGIDGGGAALLPLSTLPHAGVLAAADDVSRGVRLVDRLLEEVAGRQAAMSAAGLAALAEQYARLGEAERRPYLVLLLDGWESISAAWEQVEHGRPIDTLMQLMRDGASVGVRVVVSGDRGLLLSRMGSLVRDRLLLRLADPTDLLLAGVAPAAVPDHQPPGRGLRLPDQTEVQVALLTEDRSSAAQVAALRRIAERAGVLPLGTGRAAAPLRIEPLPRVVTVAELVGRYGAELGGARRPGWALVGAGGDGGDPVGLDTAGTSVTIAGPRRSGRTTALATMARWLASHGTDVVLITSGPSRLGELEPLDRVHGVVPAHDAGAVRELLERHPSACTLVDDVERIADSAAEDLVVQWFQQAERAGGGLVVAGSSPDLAAMFRGLTVVSRRSAQGVLLCPGGAADGDLLGVRVTGAGPAHPGRGLLVRGGTAVPVQVAG